MVMRLIQKKSKQQKILNKEEPTFNLTTKKELAQLRAAYKSGKLKFDSNEVAKAILNDCKKGLLE